MPWIYSNEDREVNRALMADQSRWPQVGKLPLKRRKEGPVRHVFPEWADMYLVDGKYALIDPEGKRTEYDSVEAVLDAGWVVD